MSTNHPLTTGSLTTLRNVAMGCLACPIGVHAKQTVFGEGRSTARYMVVDEQAGDLEDQIGRPFVGPAGQLLNQALLDAGIERDNLYITNLYITNVIKHFKFEQRGKRRLHKRANAGEIEICSGWLRGEMKAVKTPYLVCLGALASRVILGRAFKLQEQRGEWHPLENGRFALATVHPSFVIRSRIGGGYDTEYAGFVADLKRIKQLPN